MGRKKRSFIDKKNASTYHLVHRPQSDVGMTEDYDEDGRNEALSEFVLMPSSLNSKRDLDMIAIDKYNKAATTTTTEHPHDLQEEDEDDNEDKSPFSHLEEKLTSIGLTESKYDYSKHTKPISNSGTFLSREHNRKKKVDPTLDPRCRNVPLLLDDELRKEGMMLSEDTTATITTAVENSNRHLESIALSPACMDEDMAQALFGDVEEGNFEEILDDFVFTASSEEIIHNTTTTTGDAATTTVEEFDYDAHIRHLMERARAQAEGKTMLPSDLRRNDLDFFKNVKPLSNEYDDNMGNNDNDSDHGTVDSSSSLFDFDDIVGIVPALNAEEEKALCDKFEQTLLEYDDDNVGDLDHEEELIRGTRPLEGDNILETALTEYLEEKRDHVFMEGTKKSRRTGGNSYAALEGKTMFPIGSDVLQTEELYEAEQKATEDNTPPPPTLDQPPPEEDVLIDGKSYFSVSVRNPWDCESILSTYSNLDNHPTTITSGKRLGKKKKKNIQPNTLHEEGDGEEMYEQIQLSNKTGLPMGVLPQTAPKNNKNYDSDYDDDDDDTAHYNKGTARKKGETAEEKKMRKQAIKEERMVSRIQKKMVKEAFKEEFMKRSMDVLTDDVGGTSVFRYS